MVLDSLGSYVIWKGLQYCVQVAGENAGSCNWNIFSWKRIYWV